MTTTTTTGEGERLAHAFGALADALATAADAVTPRRGFSGERAAMAAKLASAERMREGLAHIAAVAALAADADADALADALADMRECERAAIRAAWHGIWALADAIGAVAITREGRGMSPRA